MGQLVGVREKASATPGVVRFELNRVLSGMGHERFHSVLEADGSTPSSAIAHSLLSTGQVDGVHVYQNVITVDLVKGFNSDGLGDLITEMYRYWKPGVEMPTFEDLEPDAPAGGGAAESGDADDPWSVLASKGVPDHIVERSKAARQKASG